MKKKTLGLIGLMVCILFGSIAFFTIVSSDQEITLLKTPVFEKKSSLAVRAAYNQQRYLYEYYRQANTQTGKIPYDQKEQELSTARYLLNTFSNTGRSIDIDYRSRGPSNLGGRSRALVIDRSDPSENTMLAGGVSGGVFRTTDGGANWTKVSPNDEIYNVTTIVQDPRPNHQNIWYYGTGEFIGNSASLAGALYRGQGIWKSTDNGISWTQLPGTNSDFTTFDSDFDYVFRLAVHPVSGDLYAACLKNILRYDGNQWTSELQDPLPNINLNQSSDVTISDTGRVYLSYGGGNDPSVEGIWTSPTGVGDWDRISTGSFTPTGRVILGLAPSNQNKLYCFYYNGQDPDPQNFEDNCPLAPQQETDLWMWDQSTQNFTNYSNRLVYEGGCSIFNDPFSTYTGYTMSLAVKPDDEDFLVIGGTNAYKCEDIRLADAKFERIGGYVSPTSYGLYDLAGDAHHPDMHAFSFSENNPSVMFSTSDGGVHRTDNITASPVGWVNLNNNFQTYQFYHVNIDPLEGSDLVLGGSQDNGTSVGGTDFNFINIPDLTTQINFLSGDGVAVAISRSGCGGEPSYFMGVQNGTIYRVCTAYEEITPLNSSSQFVTYFYMDKSNNEVMYYAGENRLYRTTNSSSVTPSTWSDLGSTALLGSNDFFQRFSTSPGPYNASSYLLMGGDEGRIYRLDDPRNVTSIASAVDITPQGAAIGFPSIVTGLAVHPSNKDIVLATYSNYGNESIFLTTNATDANPVWSLVERNLSAFSIRSALIIEDASGQPLFLVGTARGLYSSPDPQTTDWTLEASEGIGLALISDLEYRSSDRHFLIGTHGNGMYEGIVSEALSINSVSFESVSLYPNPATDWLNIRNLNQPITNYVIYNVQGKLIKTGTVQHNRISVNSLSPGIYFLSLTSRSGEKQIAFIRK